MREKVVCSGAEAGELYMLYAYVGDMDFKYIDQSVADAGGSVTFNYYPMDCDEELTVKVVGKFNGEIQEKSVEPQAQCVSSIALSEDYIELNVGAEHRLKAVLEPLYATNRSVTWSSSDDNIVTVDENGVVTAVAPGEAEITVTTAERGFTAAEFKAAQTDGWEKQYQYKVGKKKVYMAPSAAEAQGLVRADKHPKSTRYGRQNPISERWNSEEQLVSWRVAWADVTNRYLESAGREERIDHRSYKRQGIDKIPSVHLGPAASQMEKRGIRTDKGEVNRQIAADNKLLKEIKARITRLYNWSKAEAEKPEGQQPSMIDLWEAQQQLNAPRTRTGKIRALQESAALFSFLQANGIQSMQQLHEKIADMNRCYYDLRGKIVKAERRIAILTERGEMWEQYNQYKSIHKQLAKVKPEKREQFERRHSRELILYDAAARYLKELKDSGEGITTKAWQREIDQLTAGKQTDTLAMKSMREDLKAVERLRKTAEQLSRQERDKSHDREPER